MGIFFWYSQADIANSPPASIQERTIEVENTQRIAQKKLPRLQPIGQEKQCEAWVLNKGSVDTLLIPATLSSGGDCSGACCIVLHFLALSKCMLSREARRGIESPWNCSYRWLRIFMLNTEN